MGDKVRFTLEGRMTDREAFVTLAKRMAQDVETMEPDTLAYEWFASGEEFFIHDIYRDEPAFLTHFQRVSDNGDLDELLSVCEITRVRLLTEPKSDQVKAIAEQFNGEQFQGIGGVVR